MTKDSPFDFLPTGLMRSHEAALPLNTSHDALRGHLHKALKVAHNIPADSWSADSPWIQGGGVFPGHVVYSHKGQTFKRSYTSEEGSAGTDPTIKLGSPKPVHVAYVDSKVDECESILLNTESVTRYTLGDGEEAVFESADFLSPVTVKEASNVTKIPVKIIGPGWGSMAYYSKEMLKRDGPKVYTKGTPMFWNHDTDAQESQRPEGDLDRLAAVLTKDAEWKDNGPKGPGLYSEAKVFSDYATQVSEKGSHIGISINAAIRGHEGSTEGRTGRIADSLVRAFSADFVTRAGAGGAPIVPVQESQRGTSQESIMTEQETKEREALLTENTSLKTRLALVEESQNHVLAVATVAATLREAGIPFRQSVLERACVRPEMKDGKVTEAWVKAVVADFSEGVTGDIKDFGDVVREGDPKEASVKKTEDRLRESLSRLGVPKSGIDFAVAGRA